MSGVLVFVEHAAGEADRLSREALVLAGALAASDRRPASRPCCSAAGAADGRAGPRRRRAWPRRTSSDDQRLDAYAPAAWGAALAELIGARSPAAVIAGGSDRGHEVLAHVAARTGRPMVANVVEVDGRRRRGG